MEVVELQAQAVLQGHQAQAVLVGLTVVVVRQVLQVQTEHQEVQVVVVRQGLVELVGLQAPMEHQVQAEQDLMRFKHRQLQEF